MDEFFDSSFPKPDVVADCLAFSCYALVCYQNILNKISSGSILYWNFTFTTFLCLQKRDLDCQINDSNLH